jgi:DNA-binding MarR family transcriptional regulator
MRHVNPSNRRSIIRNITSEGKNLATNLISQRKSKWELMLSNLSEDDLALVKKTLRLIIDSNAKYKQESSNRKLQSIFN